MNGWIDSWESRCRENGVYNPELPPRFYYECFRHALARMAAYINRNESPTPATSDKLRAGDDELHRLVMSYTPRPAVIVRSEIADEDMRSAISSDDAASNFFYGSLSIGLAPGSNIRRIIYGLPQEFLDKSYEGLDWPDYPPETLKTLTEESESPSNFLRRCATNYILKNLWHNYAHIILHGIGSHNYRNFSGDARHQMDFEADNLATIWHVASYGLPVAANGFGQQSASQEIVKLLRANRCNRMFSLRQRDRDEFYQQDANPVSAHLETEWLFRRRISIYLSGWLTAAGYAAAQLSVYLSGTLQDNRGFERHPSHVIVSVNGYQISTHFTFEAATGEAAGPTGTLPQRDFSREVAMRVEYEYVNHLNEEPVLARYAHQALEGVLRL